MTRPSTMATLNPYFSPSIEAESKGSFPVQWMVNYTYTKSDQAARR